MLDLPPPAPPLSASTAATTGSAVAGRSRSLAASTVGAGSGATESAPDVLSDEVSLRP
ncbi:MAG: hypothetical protein HC822_04895 [Oscillochloris sp.]|nr:hypothetical protein [Oscillochloris sp.]